MTHFKTSSICIFALLLTATLCITACKPDPMEQTIQRLDTLQTLLETHKNNPDELLRALENFVEEHAEQWAKDRAAIDALSEEARTRLEARYERQISEILGRLMNNTLEIQARLADQPEKLAAFIALLEQIQ